MPQDALSILMRSTSPVNRTVGGPNVPLYPQQLNIGRNNAQVALLRKFLGLGADDGSISQYDLEQTFKEEAARQSEAERAKAEQAAYPEQIRGQYGLQTEQLRGKNTAEVARINAERAAMERETQREFSAGQNQLNRDAMAERLQTTQAGQTGRTEIQQQGQAGRQATNALNARIQSLRLGKTNAPKPEGFFGMFKQQGGVNEAEATRLEDLQRTALQYVDVPPDTLEATIRQEQPDASPDELQELLGVIRQLQGF